MKPNWKALVMGMVIGQVISVGGLTYYFTHQVKHPTPASCIRVLDNSAKLNDITARFSATESGWPDQVVKAYSAGAQADSEAAGEVAGWIKQNTSQLDGYAAELRNLTPKIETDSIACRAGR